MRPEEPALKDIRRRRSALATLLAIGSVAALCGGFYRAQVVGNADYALDFADTRIGSVPVPAPRGTIVDRNGVVLAESVTEVALELDPTSGDSARVSLLLLQPVLQIGPAELDSLVSLVSTGRHPRLRLSPSLSPVQAEWVERNRSDLPGVVLTTYPRRRYPGGEAVAHVVGYVGTIGSAELADSLRWPRLAAGAEIGKAGVEREYDAMLRGQRGERYVELTPAGRVLGEVAPEHASSATTGETLELTVDLELQAYIHSIFPAGRSGAVVALEPTSGEVLAMYSRPTFDPGSPGVASDPDGMDGSGRPTSPATAGANAAAAPVNRAVATSYRPGPIWKVMTAMMGLEAGLVESETTMPIACTGGMTYAGRYARCWDRNGHGEIDLAAAIASACDVYFYQLGIWLGLNQIAREGTRLGFGRPTSVDLPAEAAGTFPDGLGWYREKMGSAADPSEVLQIAVGSGANRQTPLRIAQFFAAIAGDGSAPAPHLRRLDRPSAARETAARIEEPDLEALRSALRGVVTVRRGAALPTLERWSVYGTSASAPAEEAGTVDWFAGFAGPADEAAEIAIAVAIESPSADPDEAMRLAAAIIDFRLNSVHGSPTADPQLLAAGRTRGR